ncbi:MurR/RpiR family transcriptional regulator [Clostridium sp. chh4-2]|uniref:MurR/RpiR family transcriptional regulator n=1 Tax=Clostridium sp. chh4-2 TaxID=2067550 RepID=UPI000CCE4795|nr:MurR/RpiR family transcriptional regulator [Clostridium sp. chh4-2]PNV60621.1 MurR/RpiR family transcriptional regulator [Clostridium sp. chh4-2]
MNYSMRFKIQSVYAKLRPSEKLVADFLLLHMEEAEEYSLVRLCGEAGVSQPTVIRFCKALSYDGYRDFREELLKENAQRKTVGEMEVHPLFGLRISEGDRLEEVPKKAVLSAMELMEKSLKYISASDLEKTVKTVKNARVIDIYGVENSNTACFDLLNKLLYLGLNARFFSDSYLQHICAGHLTREDTAIAISYKGRSRQTVESLRLAKESGAITIAITSDRNSPILAYADIPICLGEEPSEVYGNAIFSRTTQVAFVDMLYVGLILSDYKYFIKKLDISSKLVEGKEL